MKEDLVLREQFLGKWRPSKRMNTSVRNRTVGVDCFQHCNDVPLRQLKSLACLSSPKENNCQNATNWFEFLKKTAEIFCVLLVSAQYKG